MIRQVEPPYCRHSVDFMEIKTIRWLEAPVWCSANRWYWDCKVKCKFIRCRWVSPTPVAFQPANPFRASQPTFFLLFLRLAIRHSKRSAQHWAHDITWRLPDQHKSTAFVKSASRGMIFRPETNQAHEIMVSRSADRMWPPLSFSVGTTPRVERCSSSSFNTTPRSVIHLLMTDFDKPMRWAAALASGFHRIERPKYH